MYVYMLQDVEKVGMAGKLIKVADGFARNYLIPQKLAISVTEEGKKNFDVKIKKEKVEEQVLSSKTAMMAERIKNLHCTIKKRAHDGGKLYGSICADDIVEVLKEKGFYITKKQVEFHKTIRAEGEHKITIKFSSKLKPQFILKVVRLEE